MRAMRDGEGGGTDVCPTELTLRLLSCRAGLHGVQGRGGAKKPKEERRGPPTKPNDGSDRDLIRFSPPRSNDGDGCGDGDGNGAAASATDAAPGPLSAALRRHAAAAHPAIAALKDGASLLEQYAASIEPALDAALEAFVSAASSAQNAKDVMDAPVLRGWGVQAGKAKRE